MTTNNTTTTNSDSIYVKYAMYATIPEYPDYWISPNGTVINVKTGQIAPAINRDHVIIDGVARKIDTLLVLAYIGNLPLPIVPTPDDRFRNKYRNSTVTYLTPTKISMDPTSPNVFWMNDEIEFRMIPHARNRYIISFNGVIFDLVTRRFMRRNWHAGYASVSIALGDAGNVVNQTMFNLCRLIYMAWIDPDIPDNMEVDHIDSRRWNNRADNLQLLTRLDNTRKSRFEGARKTPYTMEQIEHIFWMMEQNKPSVEIAAYLGVPYQTRKEKHRLNAQLHKMRSMDGYYDDMKQKYDVSHYDTNMNYPYKRLTEQEVAEIKEKLASGMTGRALAKEYGVAPSIISHIKTGKRENGYKYPEDSDPLLRRRKFNYEQVEEILEYMKTHTLQETCEKFGTNPNTLNQMKHGLYFTIRPRGATLKEMGATTRHVLSDDEKSELISDLKRGESMVSLSKKYGISYTAVNMYRKNADLPTNTCRLTDEQRAEVLSKLKAGNPVSKIANEYGVTPMAIYKLQKRNRENSAEKS